MNSRFGPSDLVPSLNWWRDLSSRVAGLAIRALPPLRTSATAAGTRLDYQPRPEFTGVITGSAGTSYTVAEATFDPATKSWAALAGGREVTAYEYNGATGLADDTAVEVRYTEADDWRFWVARPGTDGTDGTDGECTWQIAATAVDVDTGAAVGVTVSPTTFTSPSPGIPGGTMTVLVTLLADGYWHRCLLVDVDCGDPTVVVHVGPVEMYSKDRWVEDMCCGICNPTPPTDRVRSMIPRTLHITIEAPEAIIGGGGTRSLTLTYDEDLSIPPSETEVGSLVWRSGCIESGGWGWYWDNGYYCTLIGFYEGIPACTDPYGNPLYYTYFPDYWTHKVYYGSAECFFAMTLAGGFNLEPITPICFSSVSWFNYWNSSCDPDDPTPAHVVPWDGTDATGCMCGTDLPPPYFFPGCLYTTKDIGGYSNPPIVIHGELLQEHPRIYAIVCPPIDHEGTSEIFRLCYLPPFIAHAHITE